MADVALIFPGQGSQFVGMGRDILAESKAARLVLEEVQDNLHMNLARLIQEGPEEELNKTENTQPAIVMICAAITAALREAGVGSGKTPRFCAGHSLGEYSALTAAGSIDAPRATMLVKKRGQLMQNAVPEGTGGMAAVLGMDPERLGVLLAEVSTKDEGVWAANYNAPGQIVISGHRAAVARVEERGKDAGALKVIPLKVSVPSHCPMMESAARLLSDELSAVSFAEQKVSVISNVTALPYGDKSETPGLLAKQLISPVRWEESVRYMIGEGVSAFIEIGPGKVLAGLIKRIDGKAEVISVGDMASLKEAEKRYQ